MKKLHLGLLLGVCAGILDVIPMIIQKITRDANISAFVFWIIAGLFISTSILGVKGVWKGIIISLLVALPVFVLVGWENPVQLVPMFICNIVLGGLLGFLITKYGK